MFKCSLTDEVVVIAIDGFKKTDLFVKIKSNDSILKTLKSISIGS